MKKIGLFLLIVFSIVYPIFSDALERNSGWRDLPFVENAFSDVVLESEFSSGLTPALKWENPIKVWVKHDVGNEELHNHLLSLHLQQLRKLTGLSITKVSKRYEANMLIFFTKQALWKDIVRREMGEKSAENTYGSTCMFNIRSERSTSRIVQAVIVIPVDQAREQGKLVSCIVEETTQALGLKNDSDRSFPSVFNDHTPDIFLTPLDITLVKLLYSPEVKAGMNKTTLKPILIRRYKEMQRNGELDEIYSQSIYSPLRQYLGM
ncbi:DUF2927 domain-containing protein [Vibrio viridaestus]|uniref:DUF2927 domain-containing protein n=1 Tax=Vibrio viridaestus TaxID=2487322 RepID=UPI00140B2C2F|nr:DUF2927 domain-containing protein [Vibrio viridaestus]